MGGKPVSVRVTVSSKTRGGTVLSTESDNSGHYTFTNLKNGDYEVYAPNAADTVRRDVKLDGGRVIDVDLDLKVLASPINERVTVSAGREQSVETVSKTVNVIGGQEMRDRADFSLVETLRSIPGFRIQQLGGSGRTANIKTRGLRNQDTAILIDGIRFRDPSAITGDATPFISDFTLTSVSRVEILRGSGSSLYGTNAIGGTIDFQTPRPKAGPHGQIGGAFGQLGLGRFRGNFSDGTNDEKFGYNLGISRTAYTKGIDGQDNANNTNFQSRIDYAPFSKTNISGRFFISDAFVRLNSNPDTLFGAVPPSNSQVIDAKLNVNFVPDVNDPDDLQRSKFFDAQAVLTQTLNSRIVFQGYYSGLSTSRKNIAGPLGVGYQGSSTSIFDGTIHTANGHITWTPNAVNSLTAGYEFEHERFGNKGLTPNGSGDFFTQAFQASHTFYAQDLLSLFDHRLQLAGGVRAQFFDLGSPRFSLANAPYSGLRVVDPPAAYTFDGAAAYYFQKTGTKLRAHVGNGYRVPSLYERFGTFFSTFFGPEFVALGDPGLKPERTLAVDGGVEQTILKDRLKLTAVYFYTTLIDTIGFGNFVPNIGTTVRPFGGYENQKGGIARGAEFSASVKASGSTDIFASYTYTNSDQRAPQVTGNREISTLGIPNSQFTMVVTQRIGRFWANFDLLASSSYLAPIFSNSSFQTYVYRFEGNRRGDLTGGYTFRLNNEKLSLRAFGTIENVFGNEYFENGFRTAGRNARLGISFGF